MPLQVQGVTSQTMLKQGQRPNLHERYTQKIILGLMAVIVRHWVQACLTMLMLIAHLGVAYAVEAVRVLPDATAIDLTPVIERNSQQGDEP